MPKVSLVVPVYNTEKYLHQCIDSILNQTLHDIEIICVNDGSTDNSLTILRDYEKKDNRVVVIDKENSGYGASMNKGLDIATGKYLGIVDADDYILPNMCEDLYTVATDNALDFIRGDYYKFYTINGKEKRSKWPSMGTLYRNRIFCPRTESQFWMSAVVIPSGIYRIEFLRNNGIRFNESPGASFQDHGFWFMTHILANRVLFVADAYYMYRFDNASSSIVNAASIHAMEREYDYIENILETRSDEHSLMRAFYWKARWSNTTLAYSRIIDKNFSPDTFSGIIKVFSEARALGKLDTSLFSNGQLNELNLLLSSPEEFCEQFRYRYAWSTYRDYIRTIRDGKALPKAKQFAWFSDRYGSEFAFMLLKKKLGESVTKKAKKHSPKLLKTGVQILDTVHSLQNSMDKLNRRIDQLDKKNEMLFWWTAHSKGESLRDTQMRVYAAMPPAEQPLRKRQLDYAALLADFKQVMDNNGITFWPMGGTMIGMLRHHGFVPWDDDIDISMFARDKEKLFSVINAHKDMHIEEVYWIGGSDTLRCPRISYLDPSKGEGLIDIFFWENGNYEATANPYLWSIRNRYHQKLHKEILASKKQWHVKHYNGIPIVNAEDRAIIEEIFDRNRRECLAEIGQTGTTIYGCIDMWFSAGRWNAVYSEEDIYPLQEAYFEGESYKIPHSAELFLNMQYGNWLEIPSKVTPNHSYPHH